MSGLLESFYVARQPIFDAKGNVWGYELLFRNSGEATTAVVTDSDAATTQVVADGFGLVIPDLTDKRMALINFTRNLLLDGTARVLPPDKCIVEILETVRPEPEVLSALGELKQSGYILALDDFVGDAGFEPLIALADIVKVDILHMSDADMARVARSLTRPGLKLLAEKVEDEARFEAAKKLGFSLFQGFFFARPVIIPGKKISSSQMTRLQLIKEVSDPDYDVRKLSKIINADVSLSYRLLRYINSVAFSLSHKVESISQAINYLGQKQLANWVRVVLLSDLSGGKHSGEVAFLSVLRAKFLEKLAESHKKTPFPPDSMFLMGLFSLLDALMGLPMQSLLKELPLADPIKAALLGEKNQAADWLHLVQAYERADWDQVTRIRTESAIPAGVLTGCHTQAMAWTRELLGASAQKPGA